MSFQVGDKLKVKPQYNTESYCYLGNAKPAYLKITEVYSSTHYMYDAYNDNDDILGSCNCWGDNHVEPYCNVYKVGDKIVPSKSFRDCGCASSYADYLKIIRISSNYSDNGNYYSWDAYKDGEHIDSCSGHEDGFIEPMEYYQEPETVAVAPEAPTQVYGQSGTTEIKSSVIFTPPPTPTARTGWMDEPVFIPATQPVTNAKHSANLRKLIGHRNFKTRSAVKA